MDIQIPIRLLWQSRGSRVSNPVASTDKCRERQAKARNRDETAAGTPEAGRTAAPTGDGGATKRRPATGGHPKRTKDEDGALLAFGQSRKRVEVDEIASGPLVACGSHSAPYQRSHYNLRKTCANPERSSDFSDL